MTNDTVITIRRLRPEDRKDIRRISCETAFWEAPKKFFFDDDEVLADVLTLYFTDYEPGSSFVAVKKDKVVGYLTGTTDTSRMNRVVVFSIFPKLFIKVIRRGTFAKRNNRLFFRRVIIGFLKGEFFEPRLSPEYPAMLHINIDKEFRGFKIGSRLITEFISFLKKRGIRGVHFGTLSEGAKIFFIKQGFQLLYESRRNCLQYSLKNKVPYYIFGKILNR